MQWIIDFFKTLLGALGFFDKSKKALPEEVFEPLADKLEPLIPNEPLVGEGAELYRADFEAQPERNPPTEKQGSALVLKLDDFGPKVKEFQQWLELLGYELSRFGADGSFGYETLQETGDFQDDDRARGGTLKDEEHALRLGGVGPKTYAAIKTAAEFLPDALSVPDEEPEADPSDETPAKFYKVFEGDRGVKSKRLRKNGWKDIVGVTLHQTAVDMGTKPIRFKKVSAHVATTSDGKIVWMNPLEQVVYHGNSFNGSRGPGDVGIEISGAFAGIEGNLKTFWRPRSRPNRQPNSVTEAQIEATLKAIEWIIAEVKRHGGEVNFIHAHRQSHKSRTSDPGSKVWQRIALVAKERWGLRDGGPDFSAGGYPIPKAWDESYTRPYPSWEN